MTYHKFGELADEVRESGVKRLPIWAFYDSPMREAGVLSQGKERIWYEEMTELKVLRKGGEEVKTHAEGAEFGYECQSFVVDVQVYLPW